eukprot:1709192-Lingulodinium_polyedra.AAC.1
MPPDAIQDARREPGARPVRGSVTAFHGKSLQHSPHSRVDRARVHSDAGMGGNPKPGGMAGDH